MKKNHYSFQVEPRASEKYPWQVCFFPDPERGNPLSIHQTKRLAQAAMRKAIKDQDDLKREAVNHRHRELRRAQ